MLRTPLEILGSPPSSVSGIKLAINQLVGEEIRFVCRSHHTAIGKSRRPAHDPRCSEDQPVEWTGETETLECGLVLRSVGYHSTCIEEATLPFDERRGVIPNEGGRVLMGEEGAIPKLCSTTFGGTLIHLSSNQLYHKFCCTTSIVPSTVYVLLFLSPTHIVSIGVTKSCRMYCAGWVSTGPRGVIADTAVASHRVAEALLEDVSSGRVGESAPGSAGLLEALGHFADRVVDWDGWRLIDAEERRRGTAKGKPREKITNLQEMLAVARNKS